MRAKKSVALADRVIAAIDAIKGVEILRLDVRTLSDMTDYMVIASGTSSRHVKSIAEHVVEAARSCNVRPIGVEGVETGEWILVDLGDVVAHLMSAEARKFYALEKLWSE